METHVQHALAGRHRNIDHSLEASTHFSDDAGLLLKLFPEPHMQDLVTNLTHALSEVERFLSAL
jgi:hypothetical protein